VKLELLIVPWLLVAVTAVANDAPAEEPAAQVAATAKTPPASTGAKSISGMSILGNQEAPKSLVIVPWKSSEIGDALGLQTQLDDSRQPVDKDVFLRELGYYQIRSETP
jgi:hypothetical protein